ncbi:DUF4349 domain-containing protein [Streptomyces sp. H27-C3]|uniref:DUF4349 domain-containing protein n=1 Tax=Streptomyces sp. H27-C3 TaxID=3046305 RepID=UPI0024B8D19F|nr:DUF4349 domain-containing protein [Streptomyces sp. H27-C3]MDJ0464212.1 DUF4349 domain-containing protein [Streptomyces sp. H27-C3]
MRAVRTPRHRSLKVLAAALLTASLALGGCAGGDSGEGTMSDKAATSEERGYDGSVADGPDAGAKAPDNGNAAGSGKPADRAGQQKLPRAATHIVRTASLDVQVDSAPKALAEARSAAERAGGIVGNESTERTDDDHVFSRVVLRVPQDAYDAVLKELAGTGKLLSRKAEAKDVTGEVVDVESRVKSQRTSIARIRVIMDRATKISDLVTTESELTTRQADLEALLAQQESLKDRTTMATITLELSETEPKKDPKDDDPGFLDALGGGWDAFITTLKWVAMALGAVAPFAAALAVLHVLWRLLRDRLPRRRTPVPAAVTATPVGPPAGEKPQE